MIHSRVPPDVGPPQPGTTPAEGAPTSLAELIRLHGALEAELDAATVRRGQIARSVYLRTDAATPPPLSLQVFRERRSLAADALKPGMALFARRFVSRLDERAAAALQEIERRSQELHGQMAVAEEEILSRRPANPAEAIAKLHFIAACLIDSQELEQDYFAYLVGECAEVLEAGEHQP